MDGITIVLFIAVIGLIFLCIYLASSANTLKAEISKREEDYLAQKKNLSRLDSELATAKKEAQNAASLQKRDNKKEKPQTQKAEKTESTGIDPAELEKALAESKRLKGLLEDARHDVAGHKESVRDAQATFARLREENEELSSRIKSLERSVDDTKSRAARDIERVIEREKEKAEDKEILAPSSSIDVSQELKREKARLEEKYGDRIARLEEKLRQRDDQGKQREERKEASEQSKANRLERQLLEAREFIRKKGADLAVATYRLTNLEKAYKAAKSDVELLQDQVAHLKNDVPAYTPKAKETESAPSEAPQAETPAPAENA
jgi:chromosome segregation ATPase